MGLRCCQHLPLWKIIITVLMLCIPCCSTAAELKTLRLGIMPFNSALALIKTHQPLRQHLEATLGCKVEIFTSADYFTFINELLNNQYDLAIAGPHFGSMASEQNWVPLVRYQADLQPILVIANQSPIRTVSDLRHKRIGLSSRLSMSSIGGVKWLNDHGLKLGADYLVSERATHGAAIAAVAVGELDAALTTHTPLKQMPEDIRAKVHTLPLDIHTPHLMTLANKQLGTSMISKLRQALLSFPGTDAGRQFFQSTGYDGYRTITAQDMNELKPFVALTVQMMKVAQ